MGDNVLSLNLPWVAARLSLLKVNGLSIGELGAEVLAHPPAA
jgi:hypothetical protein